MHEEQATVRQTKNTKKILLIVSAILLAVLLILCGYTGWRYLFPSDKELFVLAHYNSIKDKGKAQTSELFYKTTDVTCELSGAFQLPETMENVNAMSIHTENARLHDGNGYFRFSYLFGEKGLLHVETVSHDGVGYVTSPELTDGITYSGTSPQEILNLLLGGQGVTTDVDILEGVDKETFMEYLTDYGKKLYNALPDSAFARAETENGTTITLSGKAAWLLTDIVTELRNDYGLKNFLYVQREQIVKNIHTAYRGATLLVPEMTQAEFEIAYEEALDGFLQDIAENGMELTLTAEIDNRRRVIADSLSLRNGETALFDFSADQTGSYRLVPYSDGVPVFIVENVQTVSGTVTDSVLTVSMDVNDFSKSPSATEQKLVALTIASQKNTDISKLTVQPPRDDTRLTALGETEKQELTDKTNQNILEILTTLTLAVFGID